jgi:hypothetical protein
MMFNIFRWIYWRNDWDKFLKSRELIIKRSQRRGFDIFKDLQKDDWLELSKLPLRLTVLFQTKVQCFFYAPHLLDW